MVEPAAAAAVAAVERGVENIRRTLHRERQVVDWYNPHILGYTLDWGCAIGVVKVGGTLIIGGSG